MNLEDKFLQEWEGIADMPETRAFFPLLTTGKDGYIYAFEGGSPWATTNVLATIIR